MIGLGQAEKCPPTPLPLHRGVRHCIACAPVIMLHSTFPAAWAAPACTSWLQVGTTGAPDETSSSSGSHGFALPILRQPESRHRHWQHVVAACSRWTSMAAGPRFLATSSRTDAANPGSPIGVFIFPHPGFRSGFISLTPVFGQDTFFFRWSTLWVPGRSSRSPSGFSGLAPPTPSSCRKYGSCHPAPERCGVTLRSPPW